MVTGDGALTNHVRRAEIKKWRKMDVVLEERDGGWMIVETANNRIDNGIVRWHQVRQKLRLRHNHNIYTECVTTNEVDRFHVIFSDCCVHNRNGYHSINHCTNKTWKTQGGQPCVDRETAAQIHCHYNLPPYNGLDKNIVCEATSTMGIEVD
jgi:hypothetical protein